MPEPLSSRGVPGPPPPTPPGDDFMPSTPARPGRTRAHAEYYFERQEAFATGRLSCLDVKRGSLGARVARGWCHALCVRCQPGRRLDQRRWYDERKRTIGERSNMRLLVFTVPSKDRGERDEPA
ncbi:hypothetical protein EVAR_41555_1 [Eumeta japonica]|uniref:Uncharacterized protein n=1 Tax=Eumeta variegata TaxID=151549 RepID=A0A4C1Y2N4_EUMVA|nr:hypothetical protein EVAR_41555_1 [Eumeta japonica]